MKLKGIKFNVMSGEDIEELYFCNAIIIAEIHYQGFSDDKLNEYLASMVDLGFIEEEENVYVTLQKLDDLTAEELKQLMINNGAEFDSSISTELE